jgi:hypothetical protein
MEKDKFAYLHTTKAEKQEARNKEVAELLNSSTTKQQAKQVEVDKLLADSNKPRIVHICEGIIAAFAEAGYECSEKQKPFEIQQGTPRIVGLCDDVIHAFTCKIDDGFIATVLMPQLNVTTRKELTVVAVNSLAYYVHRYFSNYPAIVAATGKLNDYWIEYQRELELTGDYG